MAIDRVRLGSVGPEVSRISLGTWQFGGKWGDFDEGVARRLIRSAFDEGVTFVDTARAYGFGRAERIIGEALRDVFDDRRDEVVVSTKGGIRATRDGHVRDTSAEFLREGLEESLRWLGTDHVDVFFVHWPDPAVPIAETACTVADFVAEGKVRHVGLSNHSPDQIGEFSKILPVSVVQSPYSLLRRGIERELLQYCSAQGIGIVTYGVLAQGLLSGRIRRDTVFPADDWRVTSPIFSGPGFDNNVAIVEELGALADEFGVGLPELAVAWVLSNPDVGCAIFGARDERHLPAMYRAASTVLSDAQMQRIEDVVRGATPIGGPSPESGGVNE